MQEELFDFDEWMKDMSEDNIEQRQDNPVKIQEKSYEEKIARLEEIVSLLEKGDVSLEKSMQLFQEGVALSDLCARQLSEVESTIEKLMATGEKTDFPAHRDPVSE